MPRQPLYPHVPKSSRPASEKLTREMHDLLVRWHQIIGEMLIDNEIDIKRHPEVKQLHNRTYTALSAYGG